jgi:ribosomal protein S18 acetylase RimI-like enzyme
MNNRIVCNLFELWQAVGKTLSGFTVTDDFKAVTVEDSDWPNRVFDVAPNKKKLDKITALIKNGSLPGYITFERDAEVREVPEVPGMELFMSQLNMALPLDIAPSTLFTEHDIVKVKTIKEAVLFAQTASAAFGYNIYHGVISKLLNKSYLHLYLLIHQNKVATCGILFFDKNNNAGLHMIGTLPGFRNQGFGKAMTLFLLHKAQENNKVNAVLQASVMGEPIYRKLGFVAYGFVDTYRVQKAE